MTVRLSNVLTLRVGQLGGWYADLLRTTLYPRSSQRWSRFELLTLAGVPAGWLDGVDACSLSWSLYSSTHRTGTLSASGAGVDWGRYLLRPWRYERAHGVTTASRGAST